MQISCQINTRKFTAQIEPDLLLIDLLRRFGFKSVKRGCDTANCGLCTVWVDETPVLSCAVLAAQVNDRRVTTLEGVKDQARELGRFIAEQGVEQCGYCSPGLMMNVLAMEKEMKNPTVDEIRHYLSGNLCRCSGYQGQLRAVLAWLEYKNGERENEIR